MKANVCSAGFKLASKDAWRFKFLAEAPINPRRSLFVSVQITAEASASMEAITMRVAV